jgi:hypothetical protein
MTNEPKLDAEQICHGAAHSIRSYLYPLEKCKLSKDASGLYFVFRFTMRDRDGVQEIGRLSVLGAMIEDGIISERQLHAHLWQELGHIRGMV